MCGPDGTNWTSDDQCKVMYAADCTSSAGTVTGTLDVVNGSMAVIGSLPNGLAALGVMDGIPGGTGTGLFFWSLVSVFEPELQSLSLVGSNHSGRRASRYFRALTSHDSPNTVFGESHTASCLDGNAEISGTAASTVSTCGSQGALVRDPTFPCPTCRGSSIVDACMVFGSEEYMPYQTTPQL